MNAQPRHYLGVDLAWGKKNPTGLAVMDAAGTLVHLSAATDDASILAVASRYVGGVRNGHGADQPEKQRCGHHLQGISRAMY